MFSPIPTQSKVSIPNTSDLHGNIEYSKNINFTEQGYIKLASRVATMLSSAQDSNMGLPLSFGRALNDQMYVASSNKSYIFNTQPNNYVLSQDAGTAAPTSVLQGYGVFWQNNWHVSDITHINIKDHTTGNWSTAGAPFTFGTNGVAHMLEPFVNRASLAASDGNVVRQLSTAYVAGGTGYPNLTLPVDYEVTSIKYNNFKLGVATKLSNTAFWQNQEAQFIVWDGATAIANQSFSIGSDTIVCLVPYKTYWAMLTRRGRLLYFNGGGLDELATLPFNFKNRIWADPVALKAYGSCMVVEDNLIYLNIPTQYNPFGTKGQQYQENIPGGVLVYDPFVGLSNRYSASNSRSYYFTSAAPDLVTGKFTTSAAMPPTGSPIKYVYNSANLIGGLTYNTVYYIIVYDATHFALALSYTDAINMNPIIPTSGGDAANAFLSVDVQDYGVSFSSGNNGGIGVFGTHTVMHDHLLFGAEVLDGVSGSLNDVVCVTLQGFKNIGYFVTSKMASSQITDILQAMVAKYKPLRTGDGVILKVKSEDYVGLPVTTPQYTGATTWTSSTVLTTTADISEAYAYITQATNIESSVPQLECEIISGAGAGQMPQITSIAFAGGTYTITLAESVDGASAGKFCNIKIDNWYRFDDNDGLTAKGYIMPTVGKVGKYFKAKVILYGVDTTLESFAPVSTYHQQL